MNNFKLIMFVLLITFVVSFAFNYVLWRDNISTQREIDEEKVTKDIEGDRRIVINTYKRTLILYIEGEPYKTYPIAIGKPSTKTPIGEWAIISKSRGWGGGFGSRWLGLNVPWGIYGIHGTNKPGSIGRAASHGCIRMFNSNVEELYDLVSLKTRVKIIGERLPINIHRQLKPGQTGLAVMQLQDNLKQFGFEPSYMDARYGPSTTAAVRELEAQFSLKIDGKADWNVIYLVELPANKYYSLSNSATER